MPRLFRLFGLALLAALPLAAEADSVRILAGSADTGAYQEAINRQGQWFQRAVNVCVGADYCRRPVTLRLDVGADGRAQACAVTDSDIRDADTRDLFCKVALTTAFPAGTGPVTAELVMGVHIFGQDRYERCPAELGARRENPAQVRQCLEGFLTVLNSMHSAAIHQYGHPATEVSGRLRVRLDIAASGKVKDVDVLENSIRSWNFRRDVVHVLERIHFGPTERRENHEFVFSVPFAGLEAP